MSRAEILIRRDSGAWETPDVLGFADEAALRDLIAEHPDLLPMVNGEAASVIEFNTDVGPADVVVVTATGELILVECKLAQNREVRRTIVGQVVDYASRMWGMSIDEFEQRWTALAGESPFDALDDEGGQIRRSIDDRLRQGRFSLVLAVDGINDDLRRIIEFLNHSTSADLTVLAFELARVARGDVEVLMPRTYGAELAAAKSRDDSRATRYSWTAEEYLAWCAEHDPQAEPMMRAIIDAWPEMGWSIVNGTAASPNVMGSCAFDGVEATPVSLFSGPRGAFVDVRLNYLARMRRERANAIVDALAAIPGVSLDLSEARLGNFGRKPKIYAQQLTSQGLAGLFQAFRLFTSEMATLSSNENRQTTGEGAADAGVQAVEGCQPEGPS